MPLIDRLCATIEQPLTVPPGTLDADLDAFCHEWGARLLPPPDVLRRYDVLVIVPHHLVHGLPLHLAPAATGAPGRDLHPSWRTSPTRCW